MMTDYCVLQNPNTILSLELDKMLSKFWPKLTFVQHLQLCKRLTKFRILITFFNKQNVIIISTNNVSLLFNSKGGYASCGNGQVPTSSGKQVSAPQVRLMHCHFFQIYNGGSSTRNIEQNLCPHMYRHMIHRALWHLCRKTSMQHLNLFDFKVLRCMDARS
jgi:hypothetical protein